MVIVISFYVILGIILANTFCLVKLLSEIFCQFKFPQSHYYLTDGQIELDYGFFPILFIYFASKGNPSMNRVQRFHGHLDNAKIVKFDKNSLLYCYINHFPRETKNKGNEGCGYTDVFTKARSTVFAKAHLAAGTWHMGTCFVATSVSLFNNLADRRTICLVEFDKTSFFISLIVPALYSFSIGALDETT